MKNDVAMTTSELFLCHQSFPFKNHNTETKWHFSNRPLRMIASDWMNLLIELKYLSRETNSANQKQSFSQSVVAVA